MYALGAQVSIGNISADNSTQQTKWKTLVTKFTNFKIKGAMDQRSIQNSKILNLSSNCKTK